MKLMNHQKEVTNITGWLGGLFLMSLVAYQIDLIGSYPGDMAPYIRNDQLLVTVLIYN